MNHFLARAKVIFVVHETSHCIGKLPLLRRKREVHQGFLESKDHLGDDVLLYFVRAAINGGLSEVEVVRRKRRCVIVERVRAFSGQIIGFEW